MRFCVKCSVCQSQGREYLISFVVCTRIELQRSAKNAARSFVAPEVDKPRPPKWICELNGSWWANVCMRFCVKCSVCQSQGREYLISFVVCTRIELQRSAKNAARSFVAPEVDKPRPPKWICELNGSWWANVCMRFCVKCSVCQSQGREYLISFVVCTRIELQRSAKNAARSFVAPEVDKPRPPKWICELNGSWWANVCMRFCVKCSVCQSQGREYLISFVVCTRIELQRSAKNAARSFVAPEVGKVHPLRLPALPPPTHPGCYL